MELQGVECDEIEAVLKFHRGEDGTETADPVQMFGFDAVVFVVESVAPPLDEGFDESVQVFAEVSGDIQEEIMFPRSGGEPLIQGVVCGGSVEIADDNLSKERRVIVGSIVYLGFQIGRFDCEIIEDPHERGGGEANRHYM